MVYGAVKLKKEMLENWWGVKLRTQGQTAVEYLLTTLVLVTFFAGMYGFLQGQLKRLFVLSGIKILTSYY
jgi:hypothetical protein